MSIPPLVANHAAAASSTALRHIKEAAMRMTPVAGAALVALTCGALAAPAAAQGHRQTSSALVDDVRRMMQPFRDATTAVAAGYAPFLGCVSGPQEGAMGIHYVNLAFVGDGELDVQRPEALMYEPRGGRLELVGVEYIVPADVWDAGHTEPPTLLGQLFHYNGSPNRYGIPAFYELHVWAGRDNPNGAFADWNPRVSCEGYRP
jgi:hypothetical protein